MRIRAVSLERACLCRTRSVASKHVDMHIHMHHVSARCLSSVPVCVAHAPVHTVTTRPLVCVSATYTLNASAPAATQAPVISISIYIYRYI